MTAGPGDGIAAAAAGRGHLRASHADRELVIGVLKASFVDGRLTKDEFDLRVGHAFASRTYADLAALTADIPAGPGGTQQLREPASRHRIPAMKILAVGVGGVAAPVALVAALFTANDQLAQALLMPAFLTVFAWIVAVAAILDSWHQKRSRGQIPPRPGLRGQALGPSQRRGTSDGLTRAEARDAGGARHLDDQRPRRAITARVMSVSSLTRRILAPST